MNNAHYQNIDILIFPKRYTAHFVRYITETLKQSSHHWQAQNNVKKVKCAHVCVDAPSGMKTSHGFIHLFVYSRERKSPAVLAFPSGAQELESVICLEPIDNPNF